LPRKHLSAKLLRGSEDWGTRECATSGKTILTVVIYNKYTLAMEESLHTNFAEQQEWARRQSRNVQRAAL
jgi:hypothetical protein